MSSEWTPTPKVEYADAKGRPFCGKMPYSNPALDYDMNLYLRHRNLNPQIARHNYWYPSDQAGDDEARIVIPASASVRGNYFWQARYMGTKESVKRYQSPPNARGDAVIITYPIRPEPSFSWIALVEGPMDALACSMEGLTAIALMGVKPSDVILTHVRNRCVGKSIKLIADMDAEAEMLDVMAGLVRVGSKSDLRVVTSAPYKDLADAPFEGKIRILGLK